MLASFSSNLIFLQFFLLQKAFSFVLIDHDYRLANPKNTSVYIIDGSCSGISNGELESAIKDSVDRYWNTVAESNLKLKYGGLTANTTPDAGTVLVGCSALSGASGVAIPNASNGSSTIYLNSNSFVPGGYYYEGLVGVLAHELGHAVGLGHSYDSASIMTYNSHGWGPSPKYLSQDDKDGVIYLYPNEKQLGGTLGGCAATASTSHRPATQSRFANLDALLFPLIFLLLLKTLSSWINRYRQS